MGIKLHLGCGKRFLNGYTHIDLSDYSHIDYNHDIRTLPMIKPKSVELIYASHVLEYFDRIEVIDVLKEWFSKLQSGGVLRLAVPNFYALILAYHRYGDIDRILGPLYGRWEVNDNTIIYHKTTYDYASLEELLLSVGFSGVQPWYWQNVFVGELHGYDDYSKAYIPHMDFDHGLHTSLNVEGVV